MEDTAFEIQKWLFSVFAFLSELCFFWSREILQSLSEEKGI